MAPTGDVVLLYNLTVVWTSIMESAILRRWRLKTQLPSLAFCLIGMTFVTKPSFIFNLHSSSTNHHNSSSVHPYSSSFVRHNSSTVQLTARHPPNRPRTQFLHHPPAQPTPQSPLFHSHLIPHHQLYPSSSLTSPPPPDKTYLGYALALASSVFYSIICILVALHPRIHWSTWMIQLGFSHQLFAVIFISVMVHAGGHVYLVSGAPKQSSASSSSQWAPITCLFLSGLFNMVGETASTVAIQVFEKKRF